MSDVESRWNERIARARQLAAHHSAAGGALTFYAALAEYQKALVARETSGSGLHASGATPFLDLLNLDAVISAIPVFLSWLQRTAPTRLAGAAVEMSRLDPSQWCQLLQSTLAEQSTGHSDADDALVFVVQALLQPFAERAALDRSNSSVSQIATPESRPQNTCPVCGSRPVVGVLREEAHGARRTLLCALCLVEWNYLRVICPGCGEQQFDVLPVYTADRFAQVRIEACESCRTYLKTIDLTKDGLAVPLVDDIASLSLDLWAREQGYVRLRTNVLGF